MERIKGNASTGPSSERSSANGSGSTDTDPIPFRVVIKEDKKRGWDWGSLDTLIFLAVLYCVVFVVSSAWHDAAR